MEDLTAKRETAENGECISRFKTGQGRLEVNQAELLHLGSR